MGNPAFKLQDAGFSREQVDALSEWVDGSTATKADVAGLHGKIDSTAAGLRTELKTDIERLNGKINLVYWMLGVLIAANLSLVIKAFF